MKPLKFTSQAGRTFILIGIFAIAMGFLEAIVVVYMRQIYYPEGFDFPLTLLSPEMLSVEWIREFATLIMLGTIGLIAGKNPLQRLLYFLYCFGIWDIIYYVALYLLLGWPPSLLTWDILFLIPVPWIGPVLPPVICSLTMIGMAFLLVFLQEEGKQVKIRLYEWIMIFGGAFIILYSYTKDYLRIISQSGAFSRTAGTNEKLWTAITTYIPESYDWIAFSSGELLILLAVFFIARRTISTKHVQE